MNLKLPNRIPFKVLTILSGKLFLLFLLASLLITSLQDMSLRGFGQRSISFGTLFIVLFGINTLVFYFFDKKRKSITEKLWKKVFLVGYFFSFFYFYFHIAVLSWLVQKGWFKFPHSHVDFASYSSWSYFVFILGSSFVVYSFIFLVQNTVLTQYEKSQIQMELLKLEASNVDAKNQLLRQQIQPHFLFNALNILKTLIKKDAKKAEEYLMYLSDFLRISITKNKTGISTLKEELKICNDYMEMQKIRFGNALKYKVNIPSLAEIKSKKIPFFSLQSLVENAIKHNTLTENKPLLIEIFVEGNHIKVQNNLQAKKTTETSTGKGLEMLFERYELLNESAPVIHQNEDTFAVELKILANEHTYN